MKMPGTFFKSVIQYVFLFGSEIWFMTPPPRLLCSLGGFHNWFALQVTGKQPWRQPDGIWLYPTIGEAMYEAGLGNFKDYITWWKKNISHYIAIRLVCDICKGM